MVNSTPGTPVGAISATTLASRPMPASAPPTTPAGNCKNGAARRASSAVVTLAAQLARRSGSKRLSVSTKTPRWFVLRLSTCLRKRDGQRSLQMYFMVSSASVGLGRGRVAVCLLLTCQSLWRTGANRTAQRVQVQRDDPWPQDVRTQALVVPRGG